MPRTQDTHVVRVPLRSAATAALNLPAAGVNVNGRDYITVDEYQNTSAEGEYALGEVTGPVCMYDDQLNAIGSLTSLMSL
jgi:hypothetical protein